MCFTTRVCENSTCLHPDCLSCPNSFRDAWSKRTHKTPRSKHSTLDTTCFESHGWFGKLWLMFYGLHGPQSCSVTVIFHCARTWPQSLTTGLAILIYSWRSHFSLLHQSCLQWFLCMGDPRNVHFRFQVKLFYSGHGKISFANGFQMWKWEEDGKYWDGITASWWQMAFVS